MLRRRPAILRESTTYRESEQPAMTTNSAPSISACRVKSAGESTNCGSSAAKNSAVLGFSTATITPSRKTPAGRAAVGAGASRRISPAQHLVREKEKIRGAKVFQHRVEQRGGRQNGGEAERRHGGI